MEFEYRRGGTLAYFAAFDVHRAHVTGTIAAKTGIEPFTDLSARRDRANTCTAARRHAGESRTYRPVALSELRQG